MPITVGGDDVKNITIDDERVVEVTADGDIVWREPATFPMVFPQPIN